MSRGNLLVTSSKKCIRKRKPIIRVILENLTVTKLLSRIYAHFMEPTISLHHNGH